MNIGDVQEAISREVVQREGLHDQLRTNIQTEIGGLMRNIDLVDKKGCRVDEVPKEPFSRSLAVLLQGGRAMLQWPVACCRYPLLPFDTMPEDHAVSAREAVH